MINLLFRNWKLILDIILVVTLVVLFYFWNPFGIFGGGLKLKPTTNLLTEVRELGQLVTSEYYGEVIASIEESRMNRIEEEEVNDQASLLYDNLYGAAEDLFNFENKPLSEKEAEWENNPLIQGRNRTLRQRVSRRNIIEKLNLYQLLEDLSSDPLFENVLEFTWKRENNNRQWNAQNRQREEALYIIYKDVENKRNLQLDEAGFTEFYYQNKAVRVSRKESNKKLAMVGRGWVKAGFDFSSLDDNTFYVNEDAGEIHFFGLAAVILNAEINPWFIPEKGIPGFEILDYNGKVDFRDAKSVKKYCIEKLILNAHQADILSHAEIHGAETLKSLFSLMTGKTIKKVFFHNDRIIQIVQGMEEDEYVDYHEATLLDSQINSETKVIDSLRMRRENSFKNQQLANHRQEKLSIAIGRLRRLPFEDLPGTFNFLSKTVYEMAQDSILDFTERQNLEKLRWNWESPTFMMEKSDTLGVGNLWFTDSLVFTRDYNLAIEYLLQKKVVPGSVEEMTLFKSDFTPTFLEKNWIQKYTINHPDSVEVQLVKADSTPRQTLVNLLYPFQYHERVWQKKLLWSDSLTKSQEIIPAAGDSAIWVYETSSKNMVRKMEISLEKLVHPILLQSWRNQKIIWLTSNLCFVRGEVFWTELRAPEAFLLTESQAREMEGFFKLMVERHREKKNKGPIVQAHEWVQNKFDNNKSVGKWLVEVKNKLTPSSY